MKTWISRALPVLASLAACSGFVSSAGAQLITVNPAAMSVNLIGSPSFKVTYRTSISPSFCSDQGKFNTDPSSVGSATTLGVFPRAMTIPASAGGTTAQELVIVPAGIVDEIKRRRITRPVYFSRYWTECPAGDIFATTEVPITFTSYSLDAAPITARVAAENDTLVPVRWKATFGDGVSSRIESREGRFVDGRGRVYGAAVRAPLQASGRSPLELSETLRVPESVVKAFLAAGGESGLRFERAFVMEGIETSGTLLLNFGGRIASPFSIDRAELRFLDGSRFKTVPLGEEVQVVADITFSGSGRCRAHGTWRGRPRRRGPRSSCARNWWRNTSPSGGGR